MATYREEIDKIYKKIDSLVSKGDEYYLDYGKYINTLIDDGKYSILGDVLYFKFGIDFSKYSYIGDLKKKSFEKIKITTMNKHQKNLAKLLDQKGVYTLGRHYFDKNTNKYLGDIIEIDMKSIDPDITFDTELYSFYMKIKLFSCAKISDNKGLSESIPIFPNDTSRNNQYNVGAIVQYNKNLYECAFAYLWSKNNIILPTDTLYWNKIEPVSPTSSLFSNSKDVLLQKYDKAIDFINKNNFIYSYINEMIEGDYVDDYLE